MTTKNPENAEEASVLLLTALVSSACLGARVPSSQFLPTGFRSRAILKLEDLALLHQLRVLRRERPARPYLFAFDRFALDLALPIVAQLSGGAGVWSSGHRRPMA